jgi:hypothetical protein
MKCAAEIRSGSMVYISSFVKIGTGFQGLLEGGIHITLTVTKYCKYILTKLTRRLMFKKWLLNIFTLLHISFAAKAQRAGHSLREKKE